MSLQTQYRPKTLKNFVGNEDTVAGFRRIVKRPNPPAAMLFTGIGGTGKTTLARIAKSALKCSDADWKELNAADDRGIEAIRKLIESMRFTPLSGEKKVFLLDEAHMLTKPSQEALLKALEEPPSYVHWLICTTNPEALKQTFKRRCHPFHLEPLKDRDVHTLLNKILRIEKAKVPQTVKDKIAEISDGSAGQALKLLDMVIDMGDDEKRAISTLHSAGSGESEVIEICRTLLNGNMNEKTKWAKIKVLLKTYKGDGESARRPILGYMEKVMLNNGDADTFFMMKPFMRNFFDSGRAGLVAACYAAIFDIEGDE